MESSLRNLADDGVEDLHQLRSAVDQVGMSPCLVLSELLVAGWPHTASAIGRQGQTVHGHAVHLH